jgi:hypothetical protein
MVKMAEANPDVEVLVRRLRRGKAAVIRGHYGVFPLVYTFSPARDRVERTVMRALLICSKWER